MIIALFLAALLLALCAIRAGGIFLLAAGVFSRIAAMAFTMAHACVGCDNLVSHLWREARKQYKINARTARADVFGEQR